ncbi:MAG: hypothetical protein QXQ53_04475 [Candidatus Methanosuratincola sp.]
MMFISYVLGFATGGLAIFLAIEWWLRRKNKSLLLVRHKVEELKAQLGMYYTVLEDLQKQIRDEASKTTALLVPYEAISIGKCSQYVFVEADEIVEKTVEIVGDMSRWADKKWLEGKVVTPAAPHDVFNDALYGERFYTVKDDKLYLVIHFSFPLPSSVVRV